MAPSEPIDLAVTPTPFVEGLRSSFELRVTNTSPDSMLAVRSVATSPRGELSLLARRPFGPLVYDAGKDRYRHFTAVSATTTAHLWSAVLEPGATLDLLPRVQPLRAGPFDVTVTVEAHAFPAREAAQRVYRTASRFEGSVTTYDLGGPGDGRSVVTLAGSTLATVSRSFPFDVQEDTLAPSREAARHGMVVGRSRALGNAWLVETAERLLLLHGSAAEPVAVGRRATLAALEFVDRLPAGDPVTLLFEGADATEVLAGLPVNGDTAQLWFGTDDLLPILLRLQARGFALSTGFHTPFDEGLVARPGH